MSMVLRKLETALAVGILEKTSTSSHPMIIAKVLKSAFELHNVNVKLEVLNIDRTDKRRDLWFLVM